MSRSASLSSDRRASKAGPGASLKRAGTRPRTTSGSLLSHLQRSPVGHVRGHERFEEPTMIADAKVQQLVCNHEVLEPDLFVRKIGRQRDGAPPGARAPFRSHRLKTEQSWPDAEFRGPGLGSTPQFLMGVVITRHGSAYSPRSVAITMSTMRERSPLSSPSSGR